MPKAISRIAGISWRKPGQLSRNDEICWRLKTGELAAA
jgi:hypothetical protein